MGKLTLFLLLIPTSLFAFEHYFHNESFLLEIELSTSLSNHSAYVSPPVQNPHLILLKDPEHRLTDPFLIPPYFFDAAVFWFDIYTLYDRDQVIIHDRYDHAIRYEVLNFNKLGDINPFVAANFRPLLIRERFNFYHKLFGDIIDNNSQDLLAKLPSSVSMRLGALKPKSEEYRAYLNELAFSMRSQTGLRSTIHEGLVRYYDFLPTLKELFNHSNVPLEITALSMVESSFNFFARSKSGASGIWQVMPSVAKSMLPMNYLNDGRNAPFLATLAAINLLKHNFRLLNSWDLAITAYNSGAKHLRESKASLGRDNVTLEEILKTYKHPHLGFASTNFYSEFLAMASIIMYADQIFGLNQKSSALAIAKPYLSRCTFIPKNLSIFKERNFNNINGHLKSFTARYPKGSIIFSSTPLSEDRFYPVDETIIFSKYPKNWKLPKSLSVKESCSGS